VVLLGDVRELEVEREGTQNARLALERKPCNGRAERVVWLTRAGGARERPDPLDVL
jgi:hypothetical protein